MADDLKIKVNGQISPVAASADTPLLYVLTNELKLWGPRFGCGLAQCGSCSVLADGVEIRSCVTPVGAVAGKSLTTFEGLAALVRATEGTGASAGAASAAAGLHRRAGAAVRLLLQRHDDQGLGAAGADAAPERSADPRPHGRPPLPLRLLSAHHEGDPGCVHHDGGSNAMNAILTNTSPARCPVATCSRGRRARRRLLHRRLPVAGRGRARRRRRSAGSDHDRFVDRRACGQHRDGLSRQGRVRPGQHHRPAADRGRRARSRDEPAQIGSARHQHRARTRARRPRARRSIAAARRSARRPRRRARRCWRWPRRGSACRPAASSCPKGWCRSTAIPAAP